jgi:predicted DNA-binding transcriptional regulator AlpA
MTINNRIGLAEEEAAEVLGLASSTLSKLRLSGNGPVYCKLGRRVVYRQEDLEAWLGSRVARDTSDAEARLPKSLTSNGGVLSPERVQNQRTPPQFARDSQKDGRRNWSAGRTDPSKKAARIMGAGATKQHPDAE